MRAVKITFSIICTMSIFSNLDLSAHHSFFYLVLLIAITMADIDLDSCKLSHMGLEYMGDISKTESGIRCQSWSMQNPIHSIDQSYTGDKFPERSVTKAKNYCRNPSLHPAGPWCYSIDRELINDTCGIPLCSSIDCKMTGLGMDYMGVHKISMSGKTCLSWNKHRKKVLKQQHNFKTYEQIKFSKWGFPDESRGSAKRYCRNPDGDLGGPWCFIESDIESSNGIIEKQYCDIPFCDDQVTINTIKSAHTLLAKVGKIHKN